MAMLKWISLLLFCGPLAACSDPVSPLSQIAADTFTVEPPPAKASMPIAAGASPSETFAAVTARFADVLASSGVPGGALAVVHNGKLAFSAGVGKKRRDGDARVTARTLFRVGSMSKMVTAAAVLRLAEQGRLRLSDDIVQYLPALTRGPGYDPAQLTIEMALTHTTGLPDDGLSRCSVGPAALDEYFRTHGGDPLWAPPGRLFNYSNTGYSALSGVVAAASGQSFEDAAATLVFQPAHMDSATFSPSQALAADHSFGHTPSGAIQDADAYDCQYLRGPGGVFASVEDYAHLAEALISGSLLRPDMNAAATTERVPTGSQWGYGYGFFTGSFHGVRIFHHGGNVEDFASFMFVAPEQGFAIIALVNAAGSAANDSAWLGPAVDAFLSTQRQASDDSRTDPMTWSKYAGRYVDHAGHLGTLQVRWQPDGLTLHGPFPGVPSITFFFDEKGRAEYLATRAGVAKRAD